MNAMHLTAAQWRQAAAIKLKIVALEKAFAKIAGAPGEASPPAAAPVKKSKFSPVAIERIRAAQKLRWAKLNVLLAKAAE